MLHAYLNRRRQDCQSQIKITDSVLFLILFSKTFSPMQFTVSDYRRCRNQSYQSASIHTMYIQHINLN
jgi:hypothetical protein